ncbi:MAG TPA: thermonuclease family protein [Lacipirellulaceae bacterium]
MKRSLRPYYHQPRGLILGSACALIILWRVIALNNAPSGPEVLAEGMHQVRRVVDGDTLLLSSGARVRLQGIDTPETVREGFDVETWGPQASQFTKQFVDRAENRVRLTFSLERQDHYDRFLAFVWDGDVMLNEELVRAGLAHARLNYRYSGLMKTRLARAQDEARRAGRGLWSSVAATQD